MIEIPSDRPKGIRAAEEVGRLALARAVAARLITYRYENGLSQRALARSLGVSQPRVVELESGKKNPQIETLAKIAATTGIEFAFDVVPVGQEPTLASRSFKEVAAHVYAGGSLLVAAR